MLKVPEKSGFQFMIAFVQDYLHGKTDRLDWDLDFSHYLMQQYSKMERENSEMAECFNFYLAEQGFDQGIGLNDDEHKKLIREQFMLFNDACRDGII